MPSTKKTWLLGFALVVLVIAALTWLFLISPTRESAESFNTTAKQVEDNNAILEKKVEGLRADFAKIDDHRKTLRGFETRVPREVDYQSLTDEIDRAAKDAKVDVLSLTAEPIVGVSPYTALKPKKATTDSGAPTQTSSTENREDDAEGDKNSTGAKADEIQTVSGAAPTKTGALASVIDGFYQIPMTLVVQGSYEEVREFSTSLQEKSKRAILFTNVSALALGDSDAGTGAFESEVGDLTFTVNLLTYVLEYDKNVLGKDNQDETPEKKMPAPAKKNIFAPDRESAS